MLYDLEVEFVKKGYKIEGGLYVLIEFVLDQVKRLTSSKFDVSHDVTQLNGRPFIVHPT